MLVAAGALVIGGCGGSSQPGAAEPFSPPASTASSIILTGRTTSQAHDVVIGD